MFPYLIGLGGVLGYAVLQYGGVLRQEWNYCLAGLGVLALLYFLIAPRAALAPAPERRLLLPAALLLGLAALQLVPLPLPALELLAPARAGQVRALSLAGLDAGAAGLSVIPGATFGHLLRLAGCAVMFLLAREIVWRRPGRTWAAAAPIILIAALEAAYGLLLFFDGEPPQPSAHGTYVNRNHFAGLLEMSLPFALMFAVAGARGSSEGSRRPMRAALRACGGFAVAALILVAIIQSYSRMGFVACLLSLFVMALLALGGRMKAGIKWAAGFALALLAVLAFIYLPPDPLIERFASLTQGGELTEEGRIYVWGEALPLIKSYALAGCGLGGFESVFFGHQKMVPVAGVDFAHNDYLQGLVELGIAGFAIAAALLLGLLGCAIRGVRQAAGPESHALAVACTGSLAAILIHSIVDFNLYIPANALLLAWVGGIASALEFHRPAPVEQPAWIDLCRA